MDDWIILAGKAMSLLLAAGSGFWFSRLGSQWDWRLAGPLILSFAAYMIGNVSWGAPDANGGFQVGVWLILGVGVLAGVVLAILLSPPKSTSIEGNEIKDSQPNNK